MKRTAVYDSRRKARANRKPPGGRYQPLLLDVAGDGPQSGLDLVRGIAGDALEDRLRLLVAQILELLLLVQHAFVERVVAHTADDVEEVRRIVQRLEQGRIADGLVVLHVLLELLDPLRILHALDDADGDV